MICTRNNFGRFAGFGPEWPGALSGFICKGSNPTVMSAWPLRLRKATQRALPEVLGYNFLSRAKIYRQLFTGQRWSPCWRRRGMSHIITLLRGKFNFSPWCLIILTYVNCESHSILQGVSDTVSLSARQELNVLDCVVPSRCAREGSCFGLAAWRSLSLLSFRSKRYL